MRVTLDDSVYFTFIFNINIFHIYLTLTLTLTKKKNTEKKIYLKDFLYRMYDTKLAMMNSITMPATTAKMYSIKFEGFSPKYKQIDKDRMH